MVSGLHSAATTTLVLIDFGFAAVDNAFQAAAAPGSASADHGAANGARNGAASHLADRDANGADTPGAGGPATPACTSTSTARTMVRPTEATMHGLGAPSRARHPRGRDEPPPSAPGVGC